MVLGLRLVEWGCGQALPTLLKHFENTINSGSQPSNRTQPEGEHTKGGIQRQRERQKERKRGRKSERGWENAPERKIEWRRMALKKRQKTGTNK